MSNSWKRFLSLLLALAMILSLGATGFADDGNTEDTAAETAEEGTLVPEDGEAAEEPAPEERELETVEISPDRLKVRKLGLDEEAGELEKGELGEITPAEEGGLDEVCRVSIFLDAPSTLDAGYAVKGIGANGAAMSYRGGLKAQQDGMTAQIESVIGHPLNVHWNLTLAVNAISADLTPAEMLKVGELPGVRSVERENQYLPQEDGEISDPNTANTSENMVGATAAWAAGYTGAGSRIAIIDTGIDTAHQSFAADPFTYAVGLAGASNELLTQAQVSSLASQLNSKSGNYVSAKIPYGYNYVDKNTTVNHLNDTQGEHGSHVAGIAAANRFIGSAHNDAAATVGAVGMAPDAQLLVMKVFGSGGGAYDSDYMVAIEDAIILDADVCNLSLGSSTQGWTFDTTYQEVLNNLADKTHNEGMVVSISAGNSYDLAYNTPAGNLYSEDVDMHTGGSPGTFVNSLCVAAAQNTLTSGTPMEFNGNQDVYYYESTSGSDGTQYTNPALSSIVGSYSYVYIDSVGTVEDYQAINNAVGLSGKVVIVNRGEISFVEKGENLKSYNPKALIIANNKSGTIYMDLSSFTGTFPMVTITKKDAEQIKAGGTSHTAGELTYYTGEMKVTDTIKEVILDRSQATITEFSSWGVPGSLLMKPEITAPGGDIYSVAGSNKTSSGTAGGTDQYEYMSGTSMAAPHITGLTAVLAEYLRENPVADRNSALGAAYSTRAIAQSLMMSTATPMAPANNYLSILQQGAGLADVSKAVTAQSVVMMDPDNSGLTGKTGAAADGKVKAELGDDPVRKGEYGFGFTVYNLSDEPMYFDVDTDVFTQATEGQDGLFMSRGTVGLNASATCAWGAPSGGTVENPHDVDKNGITDSRDAQAILDYLTGEKEEDDVDLTVADLDEDELISSQDAYLLLNLVASIPDGAMIPAGGSRYCSVSITLPDSTKDMLDAEYLGGAYLQAFTYVTGTGVSKDGGSFTDEHSIPVLGFYGSWTDATMFETTSYVEELYGNDQIPYTGNSDTNYLKLIYNGVSTRFSGNPYTVELTFPSDRLAINSTTNIQSITYSLIRAAGTTGFAVCSLDEENQVENVLSSSVTGNFVNGIYYSSSSGWNNLSTRLYTVNKSAGDYGLAEGDRFRIGFYAIPEYNAMLINDDYTGETAGALDLNGFNELLTSDMLGRGAFVGYDFVVDNTAPVIGQATLNGSTLSITATDNQALAYVAVLSLDGSVIYKEDAPGIGECELSFDASEAIANAKGYVAVFAGDYAGNEAAVAVKVNDDCYEDKTVYVLTDTLAAGNDYLIVSSGAVGTGYALGYTKTTTTTVTTNKVSVKAGIEETGNTAYIDSIDVADTSVWTASSGIKFSNDGYYLRRNNNSGTNLTISTGNNYNTWQYSNRQLKFTDRDTYLRYANNSFSLSTSASTVYLYQKTVIRTEIDPYKVSSVELTPGSLTLYKGSSADLTAKVLPLTAADRSVTWSSSDASVATVDASGHVTAVSAGTTTVNGRYEQTATITATSNSDGSVFAECQVKVVSIPKALNGIVWDEAGDVYFSSFNSNTMPTWNKLHNSPVGTQLHSAFVNKGSGILSSTKLYAGSLNLNDVSTVLYTVNTSSYALTEYGTNYVAAFDLAPCTGLRNGAYFVYAFAGYLIFGNLEPEDDGNGGTYSGLPYGLLDSSETDVGGAYIAGVCAKTTTSLFFLDENGKIWQTTVGTEQRTDPDSGKTYTAFVFSDPTLYVDTGIGTSFLYQSLYYDGTNLYWTHQTDNETELIIITGTKEVFHAGSFGDGVWPVAGVYVNGSVAPASVGDEPMDLDLELRQVATYDELMTADVIARLTEELARFGVEAELPLPETAEEEEPGDEGFIEGEGFIEPVDPIEEPAPAEGDAFGGSLLAFRRGYTGAAPVANGTEPQAASQGGEIFTLNITETEASHNGLITVAYDPASVSFLSYTAGEEVSKISVHIDESEDKGVITIAYANKRADGDIPAGDSIADIKFTILDSEVSCGTLERTTLERGEELELNELSDVVLPGGTGHAWGQPSWEWADDFSSATATFVCAHDSAHTAILDAKVQKTTENFTITYTATVSFEGNTYTDVKTVELKARFTSATLNLEDLVEIRFKLLVSGDADLSKLTVKYTMENSGFVEIPLQDLPKEGDRYLVKVPVVAKRMTDEILIWVVDENDEIVSNQVPYSVETYCLSKLEKGSDQKLMDLCAALLNYGTYAQMYLNYHTEKLANRSLSGYGYGTDVSSVTVPASSALVTGETEGIKAKSAALVLDAATVLRYRFTPDEGEKMENFVFTCNGVTYTPVETTVSGVKVYQVDVPGIAAKDLDRRYPMKVTKDGAGDLQIDYGVLTYLYSKQDNSNENLAKLCRAMYQYHLMAKAYFQK